MITAKQARQLSDFVEVQQYEFQMAELSKLILDYSKEGYTHYITYLSLTARVLRDLRKAGYTVEEIEGGGGYKILW